MWKHSSSGKWLHCSSVTPFIPQNGDQLTQLELPLSFGSETGDDNDIQNFVGIHKSHFKISLVVSF